MAIEKEHYELYQMVGIYLTPEDFQVSSDEDRIIYISFDHNMIYLNYEDNLNAFPLKIKGNEWSFLWWMYRLSDRRCRFQDYLSEYLIPLCRVHFKKKRRKKNE